MRSRDGVGEVIALEPTKGAGRISDSSPSNGWRETIGEPVSGKAHLLIRANKPGSQGRPTESGVG